MRLLFLLLMVLSIASCSTLPSSEVVPPSSTNRSIVVSDIDGTLTPDVLVFFKARSDAATALNELANKGYKVIYVTTRIPMLQSNLPDWLHKHGFPEGAIHVAQSSEDRDHPEIFKANILKSYVQLGWELAYAYGDSDTDFKAYANAGFPKDKVFALKRASSKGCQDGIYHECLDGWTEHLPYIKNEIAGGD